MGDLGVFIREACGVRGKESIVYPMEGRVHTYKLIASHVGCTPS